MPTVIASTATPELFGGVHLGLLGLSVLLGVGAVLGVRRIRGSAAEVTATRSAGWALLLFSTGWLVWGLLPGNWDIEQSLPLHYSDALRFITAVALIRRSRWAVAISYYWGLTLNPQAMVTPHPTQLELSSGSSVVYWGLHIAVLLAPLVLIWGLGHRPSWRDFSWGYGTALLWAALVMPLNALLGTNYAFLNEQPDGASVLDALGPWPVYVFWQVALVGLLWALMTWPWTRREEGRGTSRGVRARARARARTADGSRSAFVVDP